MIEYLKLFFSRKCCLCKIDGKRVKATHCISQFGGQMNSYYCEKCVDDSPSLKRNFSSVKQLFNS